MESSRKRGRDDSEDSSDKRRRPETQHPELRIVVEQEKVSHVIGKGGSIVKSIIKQSGTYVKFSAPKEGTTKQVGSLTGPAEGLGIAVELIVYQLTKYPTDGKQGGVLTLLVPSNQIGLIIGKQGAIVRSVQSQSGARIQISSRPESSGDAPSDQEVGIYGNPAAITAAVRILIGYLFRQQLPPPPPAYVAPAYHLPPPAYWAPPPLPSPPISSSSDPSELEVRFALRPKEVSRIIGKGGSGIQSLCKQARVKLLFDKQIQTAIGGPTLGPAQIGTSRGDVSNVSKALEIIISTLATPAEDSESDKKEQNVRFILMVPSLVVGVLLGSKGAKIKETKQKSGAQITITGRSDAIWDHVSGVALQAVVVDGDGDQVTTAVQAIVQQLDDARHSRGGRRGGSSTEAGERD